MVPAETCPSYSNMVIRSAQGGFWPMVAMWAMNIMKESECCRTMDPDKVLCGILGTAYITIDLGARFATQLGIKPASRWSFHPSRQSRHQASAQLCIVPRTADMNTDHGCSRTTDSLGPRFTRAWITAQGIQICKAKVNGRLLNTNMSSHWESDCFYGSKSHGHQRSPCRLKGYGLHTTGP